MDTILLTGARSGIAASVIEKIKNKNYKIYVTVHTEIELRAISRKYKDYSNIECLKLDVTSDLDRKNIQCLDIDILICFAAIGNGGSIAEIDMNKVRENFEVNVFSNFEVVQVVLKNMIKNDSGKIIMISSLAGILPIPFLGSYCATKSSIIMLSQVLRKELRLLSKNLKVTIIEPGMYHTGFNQVMLENKYDFMDIDSYFENQIKEIRKKENLFFSLLEKHNLNSISNKIIEAIQDKNPCLIYRAPILQVIGTKLYQIFRT
ncbi:MAG: SDR family NAD(P)-dependent oxidoreductase [Clostridium sp.]|nr:SDR family NAD(P)-dependent oxidoreductase [Clostridium sp.]MCM1444587.1 SDR family NAD(P)-dependent oxidoreductase [Candidatus Amulumruptor caecigallinarius]